MLDARVAKGAEDNPVPCGYVGGIGTDAFGLSFYHRSIGFYPN